MTHKHKCDSLSIGLKKQKQQKKGEAKMSPETIRPEDQQAAEELYQEAVEQGTISGQEEEIAEMVAEIDTTTEGMTKAIKARDEAGIANYHEALANLPREATDGNSGDHWSQPKE